MFLNWVNDIAHWGVTLMGLWESVEKKTPDSVKRQMPGWLGFGTKDEEIFAHARLGLSKEADALLTRFLNSLEAHERSRIILAVAGMPPKEEKTEWEEPGPKGKPQKKVKVIYVSTITPFLDRLTQLIQEGIDAGDQDQMSRAKQYCLSGRMIIDDPIHRRMRNSVVDGVSYVAGQAVSGVQSGSMAFQRENQWLAERLSQQPIAPAYPKWARCIPFGVTVLRFIGKKAEELTNTPPPPIDGGGTEQNGNANI